MQLLRLCRRSLFEIEAASEDPPESLGVLCHSVEFVLVEGVPSGRSLSIVSALALTRPFSSDMQEYSTTHPILHVHPVC